MPLPPEKDQIRLAFDEATEGEFPHYNLLNLWLPKWINAKPQLPPTTVDDPQKTPKNLRCVVLLDERIEELKKKYKDKLKHVSTDRGVQTDPNDPDPDKMPRHDMDFSHVDPSVTNSEKAEVEREVSEALRVLQNTAKKDGEMYKVLREALPTLKKAQDLVRTNPKGMQRLKLVFEWVLCQVTTLYGEINAALSNNDKDAYTDARDKYIAPLKDLDDHEPQQGKPGETGYGRAIKWSYIFPLIHDRKIKGAKVIAKWNPHISSSGIAIPHD